MRLDPKIVSKIMWVAGIYGIGMATAYYIGEAAGIVKEQKKNYENYCKCFAVGAKFGAKNQKDLDAKTLDEEARKINDHIGHIPEGNEND